MPWDSMNVSCKMHRLTPPRREVRGELPGLRRGGALPVRRLQPLARVDTLDHFSA